MRPRTSSPSRSPPPLALLLLLVSQFNLSSSSSSSSIVPVAIRITPRANSETSWSALAGFWSRLEADEAGGQQYVRYSPADFVEGSPSTDYQLELFRQEDGRWLVQKRFRTGYGGILLEHSSDPRPADADDRNASSALLPPRSGWHEYDDDRSNHGTADGDDDAASVLLDYHIVDATGRTFAWDEAMLQWEPEEKEEHGDEHGADAKAKLYDTYDLWSKEPQLSAQADGLDGELASLLAKQWAEKGIVSVPAFLGARTAREMEAYRESEDMRALWTTSFYYSGYWEERGEEDEGAPFYVSRAHPVEHSQAVHRAYAGRAVGNYSYYFDRSAPDVGGCFGREATDPEEEEQEASRRFELCLAELRQRYGAAHAGLAAHFAVKTVLESSSMRRLLLRVTGRRCKVDTWFFSRFTAGQFLAHHTDSVDTRKLAFTIQLTDGWQATYGGLLVFLDDGAWERRLTEVLVPSFNTLTIFDVARGEFPGVANRTLPHMVTEVAQGVRHERVAVAGWYTFDDDRGEEEEEGEEGEEGKGQEGGKRDDEAGGGDSDGSEGGQSHGGDKSEL